jgi:DNA-binding MarR family transcriptional regulator
MARVSTADPSDDLAALARAIADGSARRLQDRLLADGFGDVRRLHRDLVLGLRAGDTNVVTLAGRLDVSAQALSKAVTQLESMGCVRRGRDPGDGRVRPLALTERGEALVDAVRRARTAEHRELVKWLGTRDHAELVRLLRHTAEHLGGSPPT